MADTGFEIHVSGWGGADSIADISDLGVTEAGTCTVLTGHTRDQAALIGLLMRLRARGLVILEVRRQPDAPAVPAAPTDPGDQDSSAPDDDGR